MHVDSRMPDRDRTSLDVLQDLVGHRNGRFRARTHPLGGPEQPGSSLRKFHFRYKISHFQGYDSFLGRAHARRLCQGWARRRPAGRVWSVFRVPGCENIIGDGCPTSGEVAGATRGPGTAGNGPHPRGTFFLSSGEFSWDSRHEIRWAAHVQPSCQSLFFQGCQPE